MEQTMEDMSRESEQYFDLLGRICALEALMTRVFADMAAKHPDSAAAWMLAHIDDVVSTVKEGMPEGVSHMSIVIEPHMRRYLEKARALRAIKQF